MLTNGEIASISRPTQVPTRVWAVIQDCFEFSGGGEERPSAKQLLDQLEKLLGGGT
jgi:hypothetical protein